MPDRNPRIPYGDETELTMSDILGDSFRDGADDSTDWMHSELEVCR